MRAFREIILFLQYVNANKEALKIDKIEAVLTLILILMKDRTYVDLFYHFYTNEVKEKTALYKRLLMVLKDDQKRPLQRFQFIGKYGSAGQGEAYYERLRQFIYRYGKFNTILKEDEEDMWL